MANKVEINELEELRGFIVDAIGRANPAIGTDAGSAMDVHLITPLLEKIGPDPYTTPIVDFIRARLAAEFPDLTVGEGEPIDDTVIKPMRMLLSPFRRVINQVKQNQSLMNPELLSDNDGDNLGANYFSPRKEGGYAVGIARLYFTAPQFVSITPSNPVYTDTSLRFFPVDTQAIRSDNMVFNIEGGLYYFDVVVQAENTGKEYNIDPHRLVGIENVGQVTKVTNKVKFAEGGKRESTEDYLTRLEQSLTEKSLVTAKGIVARLSDVFDSIKSLQVIGHGDPEMGRDIITGSGEPAVYAYLEATVSAGSNDTVALVAINDGDLNHTNFHHVEAKVGDIVSYNDTVAKLWHKSTITEVKSDTELIVSPNLPTQTAAAWLFTLSRVEGIITISGIPGGVFETDTLAGEFQILDGEVHIGGAVDVYTRGGTPAQNNITLTSIRDGHPLHFGLDLESFGEGEDEFVNITDPRANLAKVPTPAGDEVLIKVSTAAYTNWLPTTDDVGRYVQMLEGEADEHVGTYEILEILGKERDGADLAVRIKVALFDENTGETHVELPISPGGYTITYRIREKVSVKDRVRDRDNSRTPAGVDFGNIGVEVGDSLVLETGDDAGVYTVRRILESIDEDDTLILDRNLTKTVEPSGTGNSSGLRYRINDELDVDLVTPRVTKVPLGAIFSGEDLYTVAGSDVVEVRGSTNFLLAGIEANDILEILDGDNAGQYTIKEVTGTTAILTTIVQNASSAVDFKIYTEFDGIRRPLIRVKDIELLDSSRQPTGIKVPYGDVVDIRVKGDFSNRAEGTAVESYGGYVPDYTDNKLHDDDYNFAAKGVLVDDRVSIYTTSNAGDYKVKEIGGTGPPGSWWVKFYTAAEGGKDLRITVPSPALHYRAGVASAGIARMYFIEPTSVEIETGLAGGRLQWGDEASARFFQFSEVEGKLVLPIAGSGDDNPRDIRVVTTFDRGGNDYTVLELTDETISGVFGLELQEGDLVEVYEQVPFRNDAGALLESSGLNLFGSTAGLLTLMGSNRVSIPENSLIDFVEINDNHDPLVGQLLYIDNGPDAGQYIIEEVVSSKELRLNKVMTSTTEAICGRDALTPRDGELKLSGSPSTCWLKDATDYGAFGTQIGYYITIFESKVPGVEGTYEISAVSPVTDPDHPYLELDLVISSEVTGAGNFTWIRTASNANVMQEFRIYKTIPLQTVITEIATKEPDIISDVQIGEIATITRMNDVDIGASVNVGDRVEVLFGDAAGVYTIATVSTDYFEIFDYHPFPITGTGINYRVWGGLCGSRRMVTVGSWEGGSGLVEVGHRTPFRIRRPGIFRVSSTEMQDNFDESLHYVDIQVESDGAGDELNLEKDTRLVAASGVQVDGYIYNVENNNLTFSSYEKMSLNFKRRFLPVGNSDSPENLSEISGRNLKINYENSTLVNLTNELIRSDLERTVTASALARHFLPAYIYIGIYYTGGESAANVGAELEEYINSLASVEELEASDLVAILVRKGADYVRQPILLASVTHDINRNLIVDRSQDKIGGTIVPFTGSARTSSYFAILGEGLRVDRGS